MMKVKHYVEQSEDLGQQKFNEKFEEDIFNVESKETELLTEKGRVLSIYWDDKGVYESHSSYKNK